MEATSICENGANRAPITGYRPLTTKPPAQSIDFHPIFLFDMHL